jgi:hypothetical protein
MVVLVPVLVLLRLLQLCYPKLVFRLQVFKNGGSVVWSVPVVVKHRASLFKEFQSRRTRRTFLHR